MIQEPTLHLSLDKATYVAANAERRFAVFLEWGDCSVELYVPKSRDDQGSHKQDEVYIVAAGSGTFRRADQVVAFGPGDALFVPAGIDHSFETFNDELKVWAVFFGPEGGSHDSVPV